ncbi:MAG TPA: hypothetical protein ENI85_00190 [Deltaproteobacteria bacterium]|nr:hypothetical protein [Deltaproteobacteria bacterium]
MGFISRFILPREVDFDAALEEQAHVTRIIVEDLRAACVDDDVEAFSALSTHADQARSLKSRNMKELLDVFITPYDKESIYRMITQLDWVALSVRHFKLEAEAYSISSFEEYRPIVEVLFEMATLLELGVTRLSAKSARSLAPDIDLIHDKYDRVVTLCAQSFAGLLGSSEFKRLIVQREILAQLKEIARRLHITANTLEDMAIKVI